MKTQSTAIRSTPSRGKKAKAPRHNRLPLARLRSNLGGQPVFMALRYGVKERKQAWAECLNDERLKKGNIAVIQGDTHRHPTRGTEINCRGICSIDFDGNVEKGISAETVAEQFFDLNPPFRWSFRTGANRGFNVWFQMTENCPRSFTLKDKDGNRIGEFRSTGNYTVVAGKHPEGPNYRTIVDLPAITITDFSTVRWVDGEPLCKKGTQDKHKDVYRNIQPINGRVDLVHPLVGDHLPTAIHQTCKRHFDLAGAILGAGYRLNWLESLEVGRIWFDLADKRHLRNEVGREGYAKEFAVRSSKRKYPKGGGSEAFDQALQRANEYDPPEIAAQCFPHDTRIQLIATLCRELARDSETKRFFLSTRTIQSIIEAGNNKIGTEILRDLESINLIVCVNRPPRGTRKAKEFLYLLNDFDLEVTT